MDYMKAIDTIAETLEKLGEPLTETQRLSMAGSVAVWLEKAYNEGIKDCASLLNSTHVIGRPIKDLSNKIHINDEIDD